MAFSECRCKKVKYKRRQACLQRRFVFAFCRLADRFHEEGAQRIPNGFKSRESRLKSESASWFFLTKCKLTLYNRTNVWYDNFVTVPYTGTGRGCRHGSTSLFYPFCHGKCSCLLHMQMVRWWGIAVTSLMVWSYHPKQYRQEPPRAATRGGSFYVNVDIDFICSI